MRDVRRVGRFIVFIGLGFFIPLQGFCVGNIIVYAYDTSTAGSPPPSASAILDGGSSNQTFGSSGWVMFSGLSAGIHTVEVTAATGYLPRESPTVENAVDDPDSEYGNPQHITVTDDESAMCNFQFDPTVITSAEVRDAWTMERLEDANIQFVLSNSTVYCKYPWTANYATNWSSDTKGKFPSDTLLYTYDRYDLNITNIGYQLFTSNCVISTASPGDEIELGALFLLPVDENTNRIADAWETIHFGAGSNVVADADADGDGMNNRAEYVAGTDPTNSTSFLGIATPVPITNGLELTWNTASWRTYCIRGTTTLDSTGTWVQVAGPWEATNAQTEMSWVETNLALSWNNSYCVDVVPCMWSGSNQILIKTNHWPDSGSGNGTNVPPMP